MASECTTSKIKKQKCNGIVGVLDHFEKSEPHKLPQLDFLAIPVVLFDVLVLFLKIVEKHEEKVRQIRDQVAQSYEDKKAHLVKFEISLEKSFLNNFFGDQAQ